jgi:hypothetical protein
MAEPAAIIRRLNKLEGERQPHEGVWVDAFDHSFPLRGSGLQSSDLTAQSAQDRVARLVDSTATDAGRLLASSLQGGMTPASARWFGLDVLDAADDEKIWLDDSAEKLHQLIHNSNFDSEAGDSMQDVVAAGWFVLFVDSDRKKGGFVFEAWPIAQCYVASSRPDGIIDTIYRKYQLTAEQCVTEFGEANVSPTTAKKAKESPDDKIDLVHAIYPRTMYVVGGKMAKNLPFASCKLEREAKHLLKEGGFEEFPCVVPRWSKLPQSPYAVGPMFDALPDARMLNKLKRLDYAAADLAVSGMWIAKDDGVLNPRTIKVGARKVIVANDTESMKPLSTGNNWELADVRISQLQAAIRKLLMADQLQPQDGPAMTATEIHARVALIRQQLGALFGRLQAEYLRPLVERCFALAFRGGAFTAPPESLAGRMFTVSYRSPVARAQQLEDVTAIQNTLTFILAVAQVRPEILDNYDLDQMAKTLAEAQGVPQKCIRDMAKVIDLRDARAKQQAQAAQAQHATNIQTMAADAAFKGAQQRQAA